MVQINVLIPAIVVKISGPLTSNNAKTEFRFWAASEISVLASLSVSVATGTMLFKEVSKAVIVVHVEELPNSEELEELVSLVVLMNF
mmetsp:Transcript_92996/g.240759  ORF Transcript_92996/g.240759 Transcript_92996/m.240759 type:complete len:87 (+) Transcript_92996:642-902(+)